MKKAFLVSLLAGSWLLAGAPANALTLSPPLYEIGAAPGQTLTTGLKIYNETAKAGTYYFETQNFTAKGEEGEPYFAGLDSNEGLAAWIITPHSVFLEAGELKPVEFTIRVPPKAEPGGHYAAIFLSTSPPVPEGSGAIGVASKIGTLVLLNVSGEVRESARLLEFELANNQRFFEHLPIEFRARLENSGTVHVKPAGTIAIYNLFGGKKAEVKMNIAKKLDGTEGPIGNVLPNSARRFSSLWGSADREPPTGFLTKAWYEKNHFALGLYTAKLSLTYGAKNDKTLAGELTFWVLPWQFLLVVLGGLAIIVLSLTQALRRYNRWIIKKALSPKQNKASKK